MTTSGTTSFSVARNDIIYEAMRVSGTLAIGQTPNANDISVSSTRLNMMIKAWMGQGIHLWRYTEGVIFLDVGAQSYNLPGANSTTSYIETALNGSHSLGATTLIIDSTYGMTTGDYLGVELSDGTRQWTTLTVVNSTTLTAGTGLTVAANDDAVIYTYTTKTPRPVRIKSARLQMHSGAEIPMDLLAREEYFDLPIKTSEGKPVTLYYDPQLGSGTVRIWPTADNVNDFIRYTYERTIQDFNNPADTPDFPIEWCEALVYGLAWRLAEYSTPSDRRAEIKQLADQTLMLAMSFDQEDTSLFIRPSMYR